ncbi:protein containing DUF86 [mine drainage metagenome]|uniref:Protein containing DUF86 n=1 Tax=mine drainage metagenome TaxID=410659 RepID=T1AS46_9ZZZZ
MSEDEARDERRVDDMLGTLRDIREHLRLGREVFFRDKDMQKVVAYDLLILGEAANKVSKRVQKANPGIPWTDLVEYRNDLIHEYQTLDLEGTWEFAQKTLPSLERRLRRTRIPRSKE